MSLKIKTSKGSDEIFTGFNIAVALLRAPVDERTRPIGGGVSVFFSLLAGVKQKTFPRHLCKGVSYMRRYCAIVDEWMQKPLALHGHQPRAEYRN